MISEGATVEEARSKIWMYDLHGLIVEVSVILLSHVNGMMDAQAFFQMFAHLLGKFSSKNLIRLSLFSTLISLHGVRILLVANIDIPLFVFRVERKENWMDLKLRM